MELEEAIKDIKRICEYLKESDYMSIDKDTKISLETVLNHLTRQEKMIGNIFSYLDEHRIDDNICDEILNYGAKNCIHNGNCTECIKQYFEKKLEEDSKCTK